MPYRFMVETPFSPEETPDGSDLSTDLGTPEDAPEATPGNLAGGAVGSLSDAATASPADGDPGSNPDAAPDESGEAERSEPILATPASAPEPPFPAAETEQPATPAEPAPSVASVLEVPPLDQPDDTAVSGGGEWELLIAKLQGWLAELDLPGQWDRIRGPLKGTAILIAVVIVLRTYAAIVGTIGSLPLISGLLELVGVIAFGRFAWDNLLRSGERQKLFTDWQQRWSEFSGRN